MTPPLPSNLSLLKKWAAEPVSHIYLPASTFIANNRGYPVLPKPTQSFLQNSLLHRPAVILSGVSDGLHVRGGEDAYAQYIRHLEKTSEIVINAAKKGTVEHFAQGYQDFLQKPLQPLMDNLGSSTYETFEKDPVKYRNYEEVKVELIVMLALNNAGYRRYSRHYAIDLPTIKCMSFLAF